MNKELIEILCRILNIEEEQFINSYLNSDEKTSSAVKQVLQKHTIPGKRLLEAVETNLSNETGFRWKAKTKPSIQKSQNGQTWLESKDINSSIYFYDENIEDCNIPITSFNEIVSFAKAVKNITLESCLFLINSEKDDIVKDLKEITEVKKKSIQTRIENLEIDLENLEKERSQIIKEQAADEENTKDFLNLAKKSREELQSAIKNEEKNDITIKDIVRVSSHENPKENIKSFGKLLRRYNNNINKDYSKKYTYTYETESGIKAKVEKELPREVIDLISFYNKRFASKVNIAKYLKHIVNDGYQEFEKDIQELQRLVENALQKDLSNLTVNFSDYRKSMLEDFITKVNDLTLRESLEKSLPFLKDYQGRLLTEKELILEFNDFWYDEEEKNTEPDKILFTAITGYLNYMKDFATKCLATAKYIKVYKKAKSIDKESIENYKITNSLLQYKKDCLVHNTGRRTSQLEVLTRRIKACKDELNLQKESLAKISIEEKELLAASANQDNNISEANKTFIKTNSNKDQK